VTHSDGNVSGRTRLHDLYDQLDAAYDDMRIDNERVWAERRARGITGPIEFDAAAQEIRDRATAIAREIEAHGVQDFEEHLRAALAGRMADRDFAVEVYRSLCNVQWQHRDGSRYSCSWRYAGGLVAEIRDEDEDYIDFYCSGAEGRVNGDVEEALAEHGWTHDA
jgi:hypothetical protein